MLLKYKNTNSSMVIKTNESYRNTKYCITFNNRFTLKKNIHYTILINSKFSISKQYFFKSNQLFC